LPDHRDHPRDGKGLQSRDPARGIGRGRSGKLLGLDVEQLAHAVAIATVDNIALACVHSEPVSPWKGFSPGIAGMRTIYAASLAKRGFTGPLRLF
jgi:2-methylcitrate dehydratase